MKIHFYHPALIQTLSGHWPSDLSWELHVNAAAAATGRKKHRRKWDEGDFLLCVFMHLEHLHSNSLDRFWPPSRDTWTLTAASNFKMSGNARQKHVCGRTQTKIHWKKICETTDSNIHPDMHTQTQAHSLERWSREQTVFLTGAPLVYSKSQQLQPDSLIALTGGNTRWFTSLSQRCELTAAQINHCLPATTN